MSILLPLTWLNLKSSRHLLPSPVMGPPALTVQLNDTEPDAPEVSPAVTVTPNAPAWDGLPETSPLDESMDSPFGRPVALQLRVSPSLDEPCICRLTGVPSVLVWLPGLATVTV